MREYVFQITKKQHDYLLPVFGICGTNKLIYRIDRKIEKFFFIGTEDNYSDLLNRCVYL